MSIRMKVALAVLLSLSTLGSVTQSSAVRDGALTLTVENDIFSYDTIGRFHSSDVYMPITPMFHVHAWGLPYLATVLGAKQVYPGRYEPEMLLKLITTQKVTFATSSSRLLSRPA
jgi:acyl-CoA synthetase (AMP-forming)/AMP-acid ligase II